MYYVRRMQATTNKSLHAEMNEKFFFNKICIIACAVVIESVARAHLLY